VAAQAEECPASRATDPPARGPAVGPALAAAERVPDCLALPLAARPARDRRAAAGACPVAARAGRAAGRAARSRASRCPARPQRRRWQLRSRWL